MAEQAASAVVAAASEVLAGQASFLPTEPHTGIWQVRSKLGLGAVVQDHCRRSPPQREAAVAVPSRSAPWEP